MKEALLTSQIVPLVYASGSGVSVGTLASILNIDKKTIYDHLDQLAEELRPLGLLLLLDKETLSIVSGKESSASIQALLKKDIEGELSPASLQALTIIAYMRELSKHDISFIRGVQSSQVLRILSVRGLIVEKDTMYRLSTDALRYLGVTSVEDLPEFELLHEELKQALQKAKEESK
jgi:segregation and condensation protein B